MKIQQIVSDILESNTFVIIDKDKALIVDAGAPLDDVVKAVGENKVVGILLTHGHFDHTYHLLEYKEKFKCPVVIHKHGIKTMRYPRLNYGEDFSIKTNDEDYVYLKQDSNIKIGPFVFQAFMTPGHSPCGVSYLIEDDFFVGDTVFHKGIGRTDLAESDDQQMVESLKKIVGLKFKTLHSGHSVDSTYEEQQRNLSVYIKFLSRKK